MESLTLTLSPEISKTVLEMAADIDVTPDEAVTRIIRGCRSMFSAVLSAPAPSVEVKAEVVEVAPVAVAPVIASPLTRRARKSSYAVTIDGRDFKASSNPELLIKVVSHFTPKSIYASLVKAGKDTEVGAVVKTHNNQSPSQHRILNVGETAWYIHMPTGYDNNRNKIKNICEMMDVEYHFED